MTERCRVVAVDLLLEHLLFALGGRVAALVAEGPCREAEEEDPADDADRPGGQRGAEQAADDDREQVGRHVGEGDTDQHRGQLVAGAEGQRHHLRLVAELGDEHQAHGGEKRLHPPSSLTVEGGVRKIR